MLNSIAHRDTCKIFMDHNFACIANCMNKIYIQNLPRMTSVALELIVSYLLHETKATIK